MKQRHSEIIEIVSQRKKIEVNELAQILNTTPVTIRKDLTYLQDKGILRRERGFALLNSPDDINYRMAFHFENKKKIAEYAAKLVSDGETIILESGSACALFAEEVAYTHKNVTFITNSAYIANYINSNNNNQIILLGGFYNKSHQAVIGPMTKEYIKDFYVDKIFVGIDGYSKQMGFTGNDIMRADTIQAMTKSAEKVIILSESSKFEKSTAILYLKEEQVYQVITDKNIDNDIKEYLESKNIIVSTV